ncbi:MAG: hypothetical protein H6706_13285 [Myxococcales bacterium]|nr:hypothetical protein [Myxococcales bacterium]
MRRAILLISLVFMACEAEPDDRVVGTETGNALDESVAIQLALRVTEPVDVAVRDAGGAVIAVTRATAQVLRVDFDLPAGRTCAEIGHLVVGGVCTLDEVGERIRFTGPWTLDLQTGEATPSLDGLALPSGTYRRVEVRLRGEPTSLAVDATADGQPFQVRVADTLDARFEGDAAVVPGDGPVPLGLDLPLDAWFGAANVGACAAVGGLVAEDVGGACEAAYDTLTRAVERLGRLEHDDDDGDDSP